MGNIIPTTTTPTTTAPTTPITTTTTRIEPIVTITPIEPIVDETPEVAPVQYVYQPPPITSITSPPASYSDLYKILTLDVRLKDANATTITKINNAFTISDGFKDIKDIKENFDNLVLPPNMNNNELNDYVNSYNNNMSLLDDPNKLNKVAFDTYIHIQYNKINELQNNLATLQKNINKNKRLPTPIKGLKSMSNAQMLNVEPYPDPTLINNGQDISYKGNNANKYPNYLIYGNNGCLQYTPQPTGIVVAGTNPVAPSWNFQACNANNPNQQFYTSQINNIDQYNSPITNSNNQNRIIKDSKNVQYGFYIVNPSAASDQCLQLNNDGLSVMPCTMEASQRFRPSYHSILQ